jgi:hypothetical protein
VPERLFQAEETPFAFKTNFPGSGVKDAALVLFHEIVRLAIAGEMDLVAVQLEKMAEMDAAGGMSQTLSADDKKNTHFEKFTRYRLY